MPSMISENEHDSSSKIHFWMLALLVWIATFSLISVGLLLVRGSDDALSTTEISAACQNGTLNGITTNLSRISDACSSAESSTTSAPQAGFSFAGGDFLPALTLPVNWTGSGFNNFAKDATQPRAVFGATTGIYMNCNECGGAGFPTSFSMAGDTIANLAIIDTAVAPRYRPGSIDVATIKTNLAKISGLTNLNVTSETKGSGTLTTITGTFDAGGVDMYGGPFTLLQYHTQTNVVELLRQHRNVSDEEWQTVLSSLDWSTVK